MTRKETTVTERLNELYEKKIVLNKEICALHGEINIKMDAYFDEERDDTRIAIDGLIAEAGLRMAARKLIQADIDRLLEDM